MTARFRCFFIAAIALGAILALAAPARAGGPPLLADPAYTACHTDEECKIIEPPCSAPITVNLRHYAAVDLWFQQNRQKSQCMINLPRVIKKACVRNRCTLELTQPLPPDTSKQAQDPHYCDKNEECTVVLGDCCVKNFVNATSAPQMESQIRANERFATCFYPDRRRVKNLRCENHQCTADLEVPSELPDPTHRTKDKCVQ